MLHNLFAKLLSSFFKLLAFTFEPINLKNAPAPIETLVDNTILPIVFQKPFSSNSPDIVATVKCPLGSTNFNGLLLQ